MNAYFCNAGFQYVLQEYVAGYPRYESEFPCDIVFESTPGKAKSLFLTRHKNSTYIEYTDIHTKCISKNVDAPTGFAEYDDPLWDSIAIQ